MNSIAALCLCFTSIMERNQEMEQHRSCSGRQQTEVAMTSRTSGLRAIVLGITLVALAGVASAQEAWQTMTGPEQAFTADLPATQIH
jgi:hypothetical protein